MITSKSGDGDESSLLIRWRRSSKLAGKNDEVKFLTGDFPHQKQKKITTYVGPVSWEDAWGTVSMKKLIT